MRYVIKQKMSGTGTIHDIASDLGERVISGRGKYAVVLAAYYGGKGYTTCVTESAAAKKSRYAGDYSHAVIDGEGNEYWVNGYSLVRK
jgi:hypothetical protein